MNVSVCVGSSCHLKGSYQVIERMKKAIAQHDLEDKIHLSAAFCLGKCTDGVSVKIDDDIICGVSENNFDDMFRTEILGRLAAKES